MKLRIASVGLCALAATGTPAIAGTTYQLETATVAIQTPDGSTATIEKEQVVRVLTDASGTVSRSAFYPHQAESVSPHDAAWTRSWTLSRFIAHDDDPNIICAAAFERHLKPVGDYYDNSQHWYLDEEYSGFVFECTWDGGQNWRTVAERTGTIASGETVPNLPITGSGISPHLTTESPFDAHMNRLTSASTGSPELLLTMYDKVYRIKRDTGNLTASATLEKTLPVPAECAGTVTETRLCATLLLDNYPPVWWDPAQPGQGVTLTPVAGNIWGYHTAYGADGQAEWTLINMEANSRFGNLGYPPSFYYFSGPPPSAAFNTAEVSSVLDQGLTAILGQAVRDAYVIWAYGPRMIRMDRRTWADAPWPGNGLSYAEVPKLRLVPFE